MLRISELEVWVDKKKVLHPTSFIFESKKSYIVMGPNGSGKSTFAHALAGDPRYRINKGSVLLEKDELVGRSPDEIAKRGLYMTFQNPHTIEGVSVFQLLKAALPDIDVLLLKKNVDKVAKKLGIPDELLKRSLNVGASGGEKKKLEALQALILPAKVIVFDEIDTGVDTDSLSRIVKELKKNQGTKTYIFITHNSKVVHHVKADKVLVIKKGNLVASGGMDLAKRIEKSGFGGIN